MQIGDGGKSSECVCEGIAREKPLTTLAAANF